MLKGIVINKNFFLLWMGKLISELGDQFYTIAMAWWILEKSKSPVIMGIFLASSMLPGLIIGIAAGAYIDRMNYKVVIIITDVIRGLTMLSITILYGTGRLEIGHVIMAGVIVSLCSAFFTPTILAVIPSIVSSKLMIKANAQMQLIDGVATVVGPVLGASATAILGFGGVFTLNGMSYLISAFSECFITIQEKPRAFNKNSIFQDICEGLHFLHEKKEIQTVIMVIGTAHFFVGLLSISMPFVANKLSGNGIQNLGYLQMLLGLGFVIGAVFAGRKKEPTSKHHFLFLLMMIIGACLIIIGLFLLMNILNRIPYLMILFIIGVVIVNASIYWQTLLQIKTPEHMRGRIFSISSLVGDASLPISFMFFGVLLDSIQADYLFVVNGIFLFIISAVFLYYSYRNNTNVSKN